MTTENTTVQAPEGTADKKKQIQILDDKFFKREEIWKQVGNILPETMPAKDAYNLFGHYDIKMVDLFEQDPANPGTLGEPTDYRQIKVKSPVSKEYTATGIV